MKIALPILAAFIFSLLVGAFMAWAAWQHNAQGEAHEGAVIHYDFLLGIFGSWVAAVMGVISPFLIGWLIYRSRADQRKP